MVYCTLPVSAIRQKDGGQAGGDEVSSRLCRDGFTDHCHLFTVHCKLYTVHCELYTVNRTLSTVH